MRLLIRLCLLFLFYELIILLSKQCALNIFGLLVLVPDVPRLDLAQ